MDITQIWRFLLLHIRSCSFSLIMCAVYYLYDNTVFFIKSIKTSKENNQQQLIIFNSIEREEYFFFLTHDFLARLFLFKGVSKPFDLPHLSSLLICFVCCFFFFRDFSARSRERFEFDSGSWWKWDYKFISGRAPLSRDILVVVCWTWNSF